MEISERLSALRREMEQAGIDMYYISSDDYHGSEYTGEHFKCREYISGFTGSAGDVIVTRDYAGLWTDSRYFIQAEAQLSGTEFVLNKTGEKDVPEISAFIEKNLKTGILGFDGMSVSDVFAEKVIRAVGKDRIVSVDLIDKIWKNRPPMSAGKAFFLEEKYTGKKSSEKLDIIIKAMEEKKADIFLLSAPDEICWLLNVRGCDVEYNPVVLSYMAVEKDRVYWFADSKKLSPEVTDRLDSRVSVRPYDDFYGYISGIPEGKTVFIDKSRLNYAAVSAIPEKVKTVNGQSLILIPKAIKNPVETANEKLAGIKDGTALTKFIYKIKTEPEKYTELSAAELLRSLRKQQEHYIDESFEPIIAYGEHGAIVHYSADEKSNCGIKGESFLLCDTGGHYLEGTTDVTRTICLGNPTPEMKRHYTAVLKGHLRLAGAKFRHGCCGINLDTFAKAPLWELGLDFDHGTGHGVGYLLNVHEPPNGIRTRYVPGHDCVLEEGMITSDEPGLYIKGEYGIRTESLILCRKGEETSFGQFMYFENLTYAPFDPDAVDVSMMNEKERDMYNEYQKRVYDTLSPYLTEDERNWLKNETRELLISEQ